MGQCALKVQALVLPDAFSIVKRIAGRPPPRSPQTHLAVGFSELPNAPGSRPSRAGRPDPTHPQAETQQPRQAESQLPEEVEAMALFTDAPEALPNQGWAGLWRYQGFK